MPELKDIKTLIKEGLILKGNDPSLIIRRLPIGIAALDRLLGGGLPLGRCIEAYGPESTGKTLIAQLAVKAVQQSEYPDALYIDMERSYDEAWWIQSGVDTQKLLVSNPTTAEQALDIVRSVILGMPTLGIVVLDSIAAMTPEPEMNPERSSSEKTVGLLARVTTLMYRQVVPLLENRVIFYTCNQMRETIGGYEEIGALPGGRAQRHYSSIMLRTRRENWIKDKDGNRTGFYMEITSRKNKVSSTADGYSITLPFLYTSQIDLTSSYIDEGIKYGLIRKKGPYYYLGESTNGHLGMASLRDYFLENEQEFEQLKNAVENQTN